MRKIICIVLILISNSVFAVQNSHISKNKAIQKIYVYKGIFNATIGTGTYIDSNWILTANHLFSDIARISINNEEIPESNIYRYPNSTYWNVHDVPDLALIYMSNPSKHIIPVLGKEVFGKVRIFGYGLTETGVYGKLRMGRTMIQSRANTDFNVLDLMGVSDDITYLTIGNNVNIKYSGMSNGDSGGPLIKFIKGKKYVVGINSYFDHDDNHLTNYSAHVKLSNPQVIEWIKSFGIEVK